MQNVKDFDERRFNPELAALDGDGPGYRLELLRIIRAITTLALKLDTAAAQRFDTDEKRNAVVEDTMARKFRGMPVERLEKHIYAIQVAAPTLLAEVMAMGGYGISKDPDGNIVLGDPTQQSTGAGRTISKEKFEAFLNTADTEEDLHQFKSAGIIG